MNNRGFESQTKAHANQNNKVSTLTVTDWLKENKIDYQQKTEYQIKVGRINFYPSTGKITIDGETSKSKLSGFETFKDLIQDMRTRLSTYRAVTP